MNDMQVKDGRARFIMDLPDECSDFIYQFWREHGEEGSAMCAQPIRRDGKWVLQCAMYHHPYSSEINSAIISCNKAMNNEQA